MKKILVFLIFGFITFVSSSFSATHNCPLTEFTETNIASFIQCVRYSSLSKQCKIYTHYAAGISCVRNTGQKLCTGFFAGGIPGSKTSTENSIDNLMRNMMTCSIDSSAWSNASDEQITELLNSYIQCVEPFINQFKTENNCS